MAYTYIFIANVTTTGPTGTVSFTSIPQTFTDLVIHANAKEAANTVTGNMNIRLNADSSNLYGMTGFVNNNSTGPSLLNDWNTTAFVVPINASGASYFSNSAMKIYIPDYTRSATRRIIHVSNYSGAFSTSYSILTQQSGGLSSTSIANPLTSIDISSNLAYYPADCQFTLYGIKKD
jgi:hypothetical protein